MQLSAWLTAAVAALSIPSTLALSPVMDLAPRATPSDPTRKAIPPAGQALWTDTVSYCSDTRDILVTAFDLTLWKSNSSLTFGLSIQSMVNSIQFAANIYLSAYDKPIKNITIDMCSYFDGMLCKMDGNFIPNINFTGFGEYPLPADIIKDIPKEAYMVPNLDAYAKIELVDKKTNRVEACLQSTLTNGRTVELTLIKWITGAITLVATILAMMQSIRKRSSSPALYRWFDFVSLFQNAAASGMMYLNYPSVWLAFTRNFAWSFGLLYDRHMQNTINSLRQKSGGKMPYTAYEDMPTINRTIAGQGININSAFSSADGLGNILKDGGVSATLSNGTAGVTIGSRSLLGRLFARAVVPESASQSGVSSINVGIPMYVNAQGIPVANACSTVFFWLLIFLAVSVLVHLLILAVVLLLSVFGKKSPKWVIHLRRTFWEFCVANFFRACLAFAFPTALFSFFQWRIGKHDAKTPIVFGVLLWIVALVPLIVIFFFCWRKAHKESLKNPNTSRLWTDYRFFHAVGVLYRPYKPREHYFWFNPVVLGIITKAGFIAFGSKNQWAQVIGCMVVEFGTFVNIVIFRSYRGVWNNILGALLTFFRLALFGLLIPYIDSIKMGNPNDQIPPGVKRTIIGVVQIALVAIPFILLVFDSIWQAVYDLCHFHRRYDDFEDLESPYPEDNPEKDPSVTHSLVGIDRPGSPYRDEVKPEQGYEPGHYTQPSVDDQYMHPTSAHHDYLSTNLPPNQPTYNYNMPPYHHNQPYNSSHAY